MLFEVVLGKKKQLACLLLDDPVKSLKGTEVFSWMIHYQTCGQR